MAIISDFQDDEAQPRQQAAADVEEALAALLERCGGALPFLQATVGVSPAGQAYSVTRPW